MFGIYILCSLVKFVGKVVNASYLNYRRYVLMAHLYFHSTGSPRFPADVISFDAKISLSFFVLTYMKHSDILLLFLFVQFLDDTFYYKFH